MVREGRAGTVGLKTRDSPREKQQRDRGDWKTHLIFILCCDVSPWCGQSQGVGGWGRLEQTHTQIHSQAPPTVYANFIWQKSAREGIIGRVHFFDCYLIHMHVQRHAVQWYYSPVISRTVRNTFSFSGSKASMLWYTSLTNDNGRLEHSKQHNER